MDGWCRAPNGGARKGHRADRRAAVRAVKKPKFTGYERGLLVILARLVTRWRDALLVVKPDTILRWHREGFRLFWRARSRPPEVSAPRVSPETVELIGRLAEREPPLGRGARLLLLPRPATSPVQQRTHARSTQASGLELARQLRDDGPFVSRRRPRKSDRERVLDGQETRGRVHFVWPNDDRLTRTYVNSRRVIITRADVNRRDFSTFGGFGFRCAKGP
jgi:hypothetical protein